jgi:hypothetical protein
MGRITFHLSLDELKQWTSLCLPITEANDNILPISAYEIGPASCLCQGIRVFDGLDQ